MPEIRLVARCFPTEDRDKVVASIKGLFPDAVFEGEDPLVATSRTLEAFAEQLRVQRIRDSARAVMRRGIRGDSMTFRLNKQVAAIGKVSFSQESHPLGDIEITITSDRLESLVDDLAPDSRTRQVAR